MNNKWYKFFKYILIGPWLRIWNRPETEGLEHIPPEGKPALMVSNHQAVMDSFYFPLVCPRQLVHPAKKEYFTAPGFVGRVQKFFFTSVGQVPIDRQAKDAGAHLLEVAQSVLIKAICSAFTRRERAPRMGVFTRARPVWHAWRWNRACPAFRSP